MKPSTVSELGGFAVISVASWLIHPIFGLFVAGFSLLLVGWATEDAQAVVQFRRLTGVLVNGHQRRKSIRAAKRAAKTTKAA